MKPAPGWNSAVDPFAWVVHRSVTLKDGCRSDQTVTLSEERITYLEGLVRQAPAAAAVFARSHKKMWTASSSPWFSTDRSRRSTSARLAVAETKIGVMEDKAIKNMAEKLVAV